jgi:hypothetical protein
MAAIQDETPEQRRGRYLRLAAEARENAGKTADRETKEAYLSLADAWLAMAHDVGLDN